MSANRSKYTLTIANGQQNSNNLGDKELEDAVLVIIVSPGTLPEAVQAQLSVDGSAFHVINDSGTPVAVPAADTAAIYYNIIGAPYFRLRATGAVAAERVFTVYKVAGTR